MLQFQKLDVYKCSIEYLSTVRAIYTSLGRGNADLADQLRRASQSIVQNIAEGAGRASRADKAKHFTIARGSAMECAAHLDVIRIEALMEGHQYEHVTELLARIVSMLTRMIDP
jgi:four helix bundle protein